MRSGAAAAAATFVPVYLVAWTCWQVLEGGQATLTGGQFDRWLAVTLVCAVVVAAAVICSGLVAAIAGSGGLA